MDIEICCLCLALFGLAGVPYSGINGLLYGATAAVAALLVLAFGPRRGLSVARAGTMSLPSAPAKLVASDFADARTLITRARIENMLLG